MIDEHLPVLQIVVPLLAAPLAVLVRARRRVMTLCIGVCWLVLAMASRLLWLTLQQGEVIYRLGGWPAPWGIEYRVDALSASVVWIVSLMGAVVITYAPASVDREIPRGHQSFFYVTYLLCLTGLLGIVITGDLFNLFVFLEISSLSSYGLISLGRSRRALVAAFQYLVMGTIGATFTLIGIGLCYQMTGSLNMIDLADHLAAITSSRGDRTVLVAFAFLSVGISIKMALFPLHQWLPNAYACAPSVVTSFLAATSTKVSVYILLRVIFTIFKPQFAFGMLPLDAGLATLSLVGIFIASTAAIFQQDIKRLLAFSSIAQIGYIVLGISLASPTGLTGGILHIFFHALIKGGLFMAVGCLALRLPSLELADLRGVGRQMPWTTFAWVLGGLGLVGVPVTAGFVSKWYLVVATLEAGYTPVASLVLLGSLLAVVYVYRVVDTAYFQPPSAAMAGVQEAPLRMLIPTYFVLTASIVFGVWTTVPSHIARQAALAILGAN